MHKIKSLGQKFCGFKSFVGFASLYGNLVLLALIAFFSPSKTIHHSEIPRSIHKLADIMRSTETKNSKKRQLKPKGKATKTHAGATYKHKTMTD